MTTSSKQINNSSTTPATPVAGSSLYASSGRLKQMSSAGASSFLDRSTAQLIVGATESDYTTIQDAINAAQAAGANTPDGILYNIYIKPGIYTEDVILYDGINLVGQLPLFPIGLNNHGHYNTGIYQLVIIDGSVNFDLSPLPSFNSAVSGALINLNIQCRNVSYGIKITNPNSGHQGYLYINNCYIADFVDRPLLLFQNGGVALISNDTIYSIFSSLFTSGNNDININCSFDSCDVELGSGTNCGHTGCFFSMSAYNCGVYGYLDGSNGEIYYLSINQSYYNNYDKGDLKPIIQNWISSDASNNIEIFNTFMNIGSENIVSGTGGVEKIVISGCASDTSLQNNVSYYTDYGIGDIICNNYSVSESPVVYKPSALFPDDLVSGIRNTSQSIHNLYNSITEYKYLYQPKTTNTTDLALPILDLAENKSAQIQINIKGSDSTYTDCTSGTVLATVVRASGNISLVDVDYVKQISSTGDFSLSVDTGTQSVILHATGIAASTYNWGISVKYLIS